MPRSTSGKIYATRPPARGTVTPRVTSWASRCWEIFWRKGSMSSASPGARSEPRRIPPASASGKRTSAIDDDGAELVAFLYRKMRLRGVRERELRGDVVDAWPRRQPFRDVRLRCRQQRRWQREQH